MSKKMLFNVNEPEEVRAAITKDGKLVEFDVENRLREKNRNNIYRGYVVKVEPSIQAVFVEYGANRHGFLPFHEIHPDFWDAKAKPKDPERPRVDEVIQKDQPVLVQVVREELENKGAALTTYCTIPGRYIVLMPRSGGGGVSRKIEDADQRKALRDFMRETQLPDGFGVIVRTAGMGRPVEDIQRELDYLLRLWRTIQQQSKRGPRAGCVFQDSDIIQRMIRDYHDSDIDEILVDDEEAYERARDYYAALISNQNNIVRFYDEDRPLFTRYEIETQISEVFDRKIPLPSGGSIVIDQTEALVAIDVNSGRTQSEESTTEDTALKANVEAAEEIARQMRLRDLGGLIVIDFIGMRLLRNVREVERQFRNAIKDDKARIRIGKISSSFGLLSLSRQRIRDNKAIGHFVSCPHCDGLGKLPNPEASALKVLRRLQELATQRRFERVEVKIPHDVAIYMLNHKREDLHYLSEEYDLLAEILPREGGSIDLDEDLKSFIATRPKSRKKRERRPLQVDLSKLPAEERKAAEQETRERTQTDTPRPEIRNTETAIALTRREQAASADRQPQDTSSRNYVSPLAPRPPRQADEAGAADAMSPLQEAGRSFTSSLPPGTKEPSTAKPQKNGAAVGPKGTEQEHYSNNPNHRDVTLQSPLDNFGLTSPLASSPVGMPWFMRFLPVEESAHTKRVASWHKMQEEALEAGVITQVEQPALVEVSQGSQNGSGSQHAGSSPSQIVRDATGLDVEPPDMQDKDDRRDPRKQRRGGRRSRFRGGRDRRSQASS
ncbi:MAG: Rne/Rng family ribonuclease [Myxococcales bacterium]|nr:Rne/Rng family ribonuclease [Myxococcales bacterium]MCB9642981.1 Rne/Rng family ribonuclease [Myxococcales bacterium]